MTKLPPKPQTVSAPSFAKDFEYLIRQEVDTEHALSTLQRNSKLNIFISNYISLRNELSRFSTKNFYESQFTQ